MTITTMLMSFAEVTNIFSVLAVLLCFCAMILFITRNMMVLRVHGDDLVFSTSLHHVAPRIPQMNMMKVHIPFTFKLLETSKSSYSGGDDAEVFRNRKTYFSINVQVVTDSRLRICDIVARWPGSTHDMTIFANSRIKARFNAGEFGNALLLDVQCNVSSQVKYLIYAYWGVNIRELHICLWKPWSVLKEGFESSNLLKGQYQLFGSKIIRDPHADETLSLSLPDPSIDLGTPPRLYYPLVIFLLRNDDQEIHPDETVALINVVHIKDNVCTLPTSILAQYLKQANGQLSCLKQLYLATGNPSGYDETGQIPLAVAEPVQGGPGRTLVCPTSGDSGMWNVSGEQLCVVCQYFPLSRALLPCRHTCICASCFDKLDRCPMCRGPIKSYFCIRGEEYMPLTNAKTALNSTHQSPVCNWLDALNDRLIDFLGFQR